MYKTTYQSRIKRIEKIRNPLKYGVYHVDCCDDGDYIVTNTITGTTKQMDRVEYHRWEKTLTNNDVVIMDDISK